MTVEEYYYLMSPEGGCGDPRPVGGQIEQFLNWYTGDVTNLVSFVLKYRLYCLKYLKNTG